MLIEQLAAVAVRTYVLIDRRAADRRAHHPGVGVRLTVLTMSILGHALIVTVSAAVVVCNAPGGSFVTPSSEFTVTVPQPSP